MQPSPLMNALIQDLRTLYPAVDTVSGFCLEVEMNGQGRLVILEQDRGVLVSVGCYREGVDGLPLADPEILFYLDWQEQWLPMALTRPGLGTVAYAAVTEGCVELFNVNGQIALAAYADLWAQELRAQVQVPEHLSADALPTFSKQECSSTMQAFVERLLDQNGVDVAKQGAVVRFDTLDECLVIAWAGRDRVAVARCVKEAELLTPDPDMVFYTGYRQGWIPVELRHSEENWTSYLQWAETGAVAVYDAHGEMIFASFTEYWAQQLMTKTWVLVGTPREQKGKRP